MRFGMTINQIIIFSCLLLDISSGLKSHEDDLRERLFKNYNSQSLPNRKMNINVGFTLLHFDVNEETSSMDLDLWMAFRWTDPRLSWQGTEFADIEKIAVKHKVIWHPDVTLYNNAEKNYFDVFGRTHYLINSDGSIIWVPPTHVKASCVIDLTWWPHDIQSCRAKFGSWVHSGEVLNIELKDENVKFDLTEIYRDDGDSGDNSSLTRQEWSVVSSNLARHEKFYDCCPEMYVDITLEMSLQRNAPAYAWIVQGPAIVLSILTLLIFILPPSSGEKIFLGGVGLVLDVVFLFGISMLIKHSPSHTPYIIRLVSNQLILTGASVIVATVVLRIVRNPHSSGLPAILKAPVAFLSTPLCLKGYSEMVTNSMRPLSHPLKGEDMEMGDGEGFPQSEGGEGEWMILAAVVDRICLIVYTVIFVIHMICFMDVL